MPATNSAARAANGAARPLSEDALDRFIRLAGMLGSDHAGERAVAALKATELLKTHRLTWAEVLEPLRALSKPERRRGPQEQPAAWREAVRFCLKHANRLTEWERRFLGSLERRRFVSQKQRDVLASILEKIAETAHV